MGTLTKECIECIQTLLRYRDFAPNCTTARELSDILLDGEILCDLLTELSNGQISYEGATYASANSHALARKNLQFFLSQCTEVLHIPESDLFQPDDLLLMRDPEKVVKAVLNVVKRTSSVELTQYETVQTRGRGQLENVVKEICDHERCLIEKLEILLKYRTEFLGLLSEWSPDFVEVVFKHVELLYVLHRDLHVKLSSVAEQGCEQFCQQLSAVFTEFSPRLEIYTSYFAHLPAANARMDAEFKKRPQTLAQLRLLENRFGGLSFRGIYDSPIRQTTNYVQLFKRLQKSTLNELPASTKSVENAVEQIEALLLKANTFKRQAEQLASVNEVLSHVGNLPPELANPELVGWHLADDLCKVKVSRDRKVEQRSCLCVLTTKQLLLASMANKRDPGSTFWLNIPLVSSLQVKACDKGSTGLEVSLENGDKIILLASQSKCHDPGKWVTLVNDVKELNYPEGWNTKGHSFELKSFPTGSKCTRCCEPLDGSVMQGYHCSHCDKQLHLRCLKELMRLKADDFYHKNIDRLQAEELLKNQPVGTFLIRDSRNPGVRAISIAVLPVLPDKEVEHMTIEESNGKCNIGNAATWCNSLDELLGFYTENKLSINFKALDFKLGEGVEPASVVRQLEPNISERTDL